MSAWDASDLVGAVLHGRPALAQFRSGRGFDVEARLSVHRNNIAAGLSDSLEAGFPVVSALVGRPFFRAMAVAFLRSHPPTSPILIEWGEEFPEFVAGHAPAASVAFLGDIAQLEAMRVRAFHADDATPLEPGAFAARMADADCLASTRVVLHPAFQMLVSRHPVFSIWAAHQSARSDGDISDGASAEIQDNASVDLGSIDLAAGETVVVARPALEVVTEPMPPGGKAFLEALSDGRTLGAAAVTASREPGAVLPELLALMIRLGLVTGFNPRKPSS